MNRLSNLGWGTGDVKIVKRVLAPLHPDFQRDPEVQFAALMGARFANYECMERLAALASKLRKSV